MNQQKYMYDNNVHSVPDRIVSISQPYIRPIVRGKAAAPVEFGAKFDLSLDENGLGRIEKLSFDAYNESDVLVDAAERYKDRTGRYPERILADKIYRNRINLQYCKEHSIRLSGPSLGRPKKDQSADKKLEYIDNADRVAVERAFSLAKRAYSMGTYPHKARSYDKEFYRTVYFGDEHRPPDSGLFVPIYDNDIFKVRSAFKRRSGSSIYTVKWLTPKSGRY
jgi:hypothetical protein